MQPDKRKYAALLARKSPPSPLVRDCLLAFVFGGAICTVGEGVRMFWLSRGLDTDGTAAATAITMVFLGALLTCVEAVSVAGALLEQTIDYLLNRVQFGVPLASHQALRHRVAEMYVEYENLRGLVLQALRAAGQVTSFRQLAKLTAADWQGVITSQPVPPADQVPPDVTGPDQATRVTRYAQTLERVMLDAAPTQAMAHRAQADQTRSAGLRTFSISLSRDR